MRTTTLTATSAAASLVLAQICVTLTTDAFATTSSSSQNHHLTNKYSPLSPHFQYQYDQSKHSNRYQSSIRTHLYRKFHDYGWKQLMSGDDAGRDNVPEELKSNTSPAKGKGTGTNIVAHIRSISQFPCLSTEKMGDKNNEVLRLARSALLETQLPTGDALITPSTIHVLNFVMFPSPHIRDRNYDGNENDRYVGLPIFGADIVSLPGNKHLVALDFQPVLPLDNDGVDVNGKERTSLFPQQYSHLERKLQAIQSKYQNRESESGSTSLLPWGGDIPPQAQRFFSPYALWTRLGDEHAVETVNTVVWQAFQEYTDLYVELMRAVKKDVHEGKLEVIAQADGDNMVLKGQMDYLEYRRTNDPARPMLQRLYGNEWAERVISEVLFPDL